MTVMAEHDATIQRMSALLIANDRRVGISRYRKQIALLSYSQGRAIVCGILEQPTAPMTSARIGLLLGSIRRVGVSKASKWIKEAGIVSADRKVGELTDRQRMALAAAIRKGCE